MKAYIIFFFLVLFTPFGFSGEKPADMFLVGPNSTEIQNPLVTIRTVIDDTLKKITDNQKTIESNPNVLHAIVTDQIDLLFDLNLISRLVLARNYHEATEDEKIRFAQEFTRTLVFSYSKLLFSAKDITIEYKKPIYKKPIYKKQNTRALIRTVVSFRRKRGLESVAMNYKIILQDDTWKVWSLSVDNIGLVFTYRSYFGDIIDRRGISGLIQKLKLKNDKQQRSFL